MPGGDARKNPPDPKERVRKNIEEGRGIRLFGGDEKNISVIGQSAGGHSISTLISMPSANGLFQKAIICDGGAETFQPKEESNRLALKLLEEYNLSLIHI